MHHVLDPTNSTRALPQELIDEIVGHLKEDTKSLLSLALVCTSFRFEAQKQLFRRVAFLPERKPAEMGYKCLVKSSDEEEQFPWVSSSKSIYSFLSVINSNHPVGSLIHDFSLALSKDGTEGLELNCSDLHHALQQMVSLRRLGITFHSSTNISMAAVLADLPCQLTSLCLMNLRSFGNPDEANAFNTFISSQHHIKYLHLITTSLLYPLPIHCPTLETFIGSPALFRGTLSDLPRISSLGLVDSPWSAAVPKSLLEPTSSALSQVRVLTLYSCFFDEVDLEKLAKHLQSLEILNIVLDNRSTTNRLTKRAMATLGCIHKFPQLQKVIWCALPDKRRLNQLSLLTEETQKNLTKSWFESLKNFRGAYFAIGPNVNTYWRWSRGKAEPDEVSSLAFRDCTLFNDIIFDHCLWG